MLVKEKRYKNRWFKISEVIDLLKKRNETDIISFKYILQNACLYLEHKQLPNAAIDDDDEEPHTDILTSFSRPSPKNISIYFHPENIINAAVINDDDEFKNILQNIEVLGYIPLRLRCIMDLIDKNETQINTFILPSQQHIDERGLFAKYEKYGEGYYDKKQVHQCEIMEEQVPRIRDSDIGNLFIYRTDVAKLIKSYSKVFKKKDPCLPTNEGTKETKKRKPEIDNYKNAAANCLGRLIWSKYKNILSSDLSKFWLFTVIHSYKFRECKEDGYFENVNKDSIIQSHHNDSLYGTITEWLKISCPIHLELTGRPSKEKSKLSTTELEEMELQIALLLKPIIDVLIRSIEFYDPGIDSKYNEFPERIDLDIIVDKAKPKDPLLKDDQFWSDFLEKYKLTLNLELKQP